MTNRWGADVAPDESIVAWMHNAANGWGYNQHDPENQIRAQSLRLRNLVDEAFGRYAAQLRGTLHRLRQDLPEPTREDPFPPKQALQAIAECEKRLRSVEEVRVAVQGMAAPSSDIVWRRRVDHIAFLDRLRAIDMELFAALLDPEEDLVTRSQDAVRKRDSLLRSHIAWGD